jgi:hypothetical protein
MQAQLAPVLRLEQHPVVVPVRQQLSRQDPEGGRAEVGPLRRHRRIDQPTGERSRVADVNPDSLGQAELEPTGHQGRASRALQPCKGLSQVGAGVVLGGVRPERTGNRGSSDHPAVQRQERNEAL